MPTAEEKHPHREDAFREELGSVGFGERIRLLYRKGGGNRKGRSMVMAGKRRRMKMEGVVVEGAATAGLQRRSMIGLSRIEEDGHTDWQDL